jgi:hypothetical protein
MAARSDRKDIDMTQYLLSVWHGPEGPEAMAGLTEADWSAVVAQVDAFNQQLQAAGKWVFAGGLEPRDTATCVDDVGGGNVVTDGPFIESKENLGGFWIIDADDLDEALEWARQGSRACRNKIEVRPFQAGQPGE